MRRDVMNCKLDNRKNSLSCLSPAYYRYHHLTKNYKILRCRCGWWISNKMLPQYKTLQFLVLWLQLQSIQQQKRTFQMCKLILAQYLKYTCRRQSWSKVCLINFLNGKRYAVYCVRSSLSSCKMLTSKNWGRIKSARNWTRIGILTNGQAIN